jgi:hypothetical protein
MTLTKEQLELVRGGQSVQLTEEGTDLVILRADIFDRPSFQLDNSDQVDAWVENDHLDFEVLYVYRGVVKKYRPDFLVRLVNGDMLVWKQKARIVGIHHWTPFADFERGCNRSEITFSRFDSAQEQ